MSKKSKIILICLAVLVVVIAAITVPLVLIKFNGTPKLTPPSVEVFESENLIVFNASKVEGAKEYQFIITMPDGTSPTYSSPTNAFTLDFLGGSSALKSKFVAGKYSVQCYVTAEDAKNNSFKSNPVFFTRTLQLNAPRLDKQGKNFIWETVKNANLYEIIISANNGTVSKFVEGIEGSIQEISISSLKTEFDLQKNVEYIITVRAFSENEYYSTSFYSNGLEFYV